MCSVISLSLQKLTEPFIKILLSKKHASKEVLSFSKKIHLEGKCGKVTKSNILRKFIK